MTPAQSAQRANRPDFEVGTCEFTPGPWKLERLGDYSDFDGASQIVTADDRRLAAIHVSDGETKANARLIAAAPQLLSALRRMYSPAVHEHLRQLKRTDSANAFELLALDNNEAAFAAIAAATKGAP